MKGYYALKVIGRAIIKLLQSFPVTFFSYKFFAKKPFQNVISGSPPLFKFGDNPDFRGILFVKIRQAKKERLQRTAVYSNMMKHFFD